MNKTIIININGIVFHIEEDAYEVLKAYMTDVKRHFAYTADSEEIVSDIESRIAEMFTEILADEAKQVVVLKDVQQVTAQMGAVNEFSDLDDAAIPNAQFTTSEKKLFRDVDDRILGGVCAGIAHYFDIQPRVARIIALLTLFAGGAGIVIYAILWLIMPKAITRAEKMAMKGEPINLHNFKKSFDDEAENFRRSASTGLSNASNFLRSIVDLIKRVSGGLFGVLVKAIGALIILTGVLALLATILGLLTLLGLGNSDALNLFPFTAINPEYKSPLYFSAFVLIIIPIVALILFAIRVLFNRKIVTRTGSFVMLIIWITGLIAGVYYGSRLAAEFAEEATFEQSVMLKPLPAYRLELNEELMLDKEDSLEYGLNPNESFGKITSNNNQDRHGEPQSVNIDIEKGDVAAPVLIQEFSSEGINFKTALKSAQQIRYQFSQKDSVLKFDWRTHIPNNALWRGQRVRLKLRIPANTRLYIDGKLNPYVSGVDLRDCQPEAAPYDAISEWMMTDSGLKCKNDSLYQHNKNQ